MADPDPDAAVGPAVDPAAAAADAPDVTAPESGPGLADLDERVRRRVVGLAASRLGDIPVQEVPPRLRPFVRFAARRRAELAGPVLDAVLAHDAVFRQRVADALGGPAAPGADTPPVELAALAWLTRHPGWVEAVAVVPPVGSVRSGADLASVRLTEALAAARADARRDRAIASRCWFGVSAELTRTARAEVDSLRVEVAAARSEAQRAVRATAAADERASLAERERDAVAARAVADGVTAAAGERRLRLRVAELEQAVGDGRRDGRRDRAAADTRLRLLVDTVVGAAHGLAAELALPATAPSLPADAVDARPPGDPGADAVLRWDDPALLPRFLSLPGAHLIVDGYNVTKAAVPTLTLEEQRAQLVRVLGALAVQTGAEVTVVFDGSDVTVVPAAAVRGVRVRFSPHGVTADVVIRAMARAEPVGRPVVVVSSDREVADGVSRAGARPAPSSVLTARLLAGRAV